jgi:hypothetical protein
VTPRVLGVVPQSERLIERRTGYGWPMDALRRGAFGGAVATAAMTLPMLWLRRIDRVDAIAPEHITAAGFDVAGVRPSVAGHVAATTTSHLAYGTVAGAVYAVALGRRQARTRSGIAYGLALAVGAYQGWVPALGILPSLARQDTGRRSEVIVSHAVYGATLAAVVRALLTGTGEHAGGGADDDRVMAG